MSVLLKTIRVSHLKVIFDTIKDLVQDVNIYFMSDQDPETPGAVIAAMDATDISLVYLFLHKQEIDKAGIYTCSKPCKAGINVPEFYKFLKNIHDKDTITIQIKPEDPNKLLLSFENDAKTKYGTYKFTLMDLDDEKIEIPNVVYHNTVSLESSEFQKLCRDLNGLGSQIVKIASTGSQFIMSAVGDTVEGTLGQETKDGKEIPESEHVCNNYPLKFLICFSKASKISHQITVYLKKDWFLVMEYEIPSLGKLRLCLAHYDPEEESRISMPEISYSDVPISIDMPVYPEAEPSKKRSKPTKKKQRPIKRKKYSHSVPAIPSLSFDIKPPPFLNK